MCGPKEYGFSAVLVINRASILADFDHFSHMHGMVLHSSLDVDMILTREATFSSLSKRKSRKALHKLCLR